MFDVNDCISNSIDLNYLLGKFVLELRAVIRIFDKDGYILQKYGILDDDKDPVMWDTDFFRLLFGYGWQDCPQPYFEGEHVVYVVIRMDYGCRMIIGPVSQVPVYAELNKMVIQTHHLNPEDEFRLSYCSREYFFSCVLTIFHLVTGLKVTTDELWERNFMDQGMKDKLEQNLVETIISRQEQEAAHTPYNQEMREMKSIEEGNVEVLRQVIAEPVVGERGVLSSDAVRQAKNIAISMITLASRAAIDGGINAETAFTVCDSYIRMTESLSQPEQIETVMREAEYKLAEMVRQLKVKEELPHPLVKKVKDYIFCNLQSDIKVSDMAEQFAVNADYLSFLFHKSTGKTISRYVLEEKVKAAESMLVYTDNSLQEIAFVLNFSSQSHFSTVFRKIVGVTPRQYRDMYTMDKSAELSSQS